MLLPLAPAAILALMAIALWEVCRRIQNPNDPVKPDEFLPLCTTLLSVTAIVLPLIANVHVNIVSLPGADYSRGLILGSMIVDAVAVAMGSWLAISLRARSLNRRQVFYLLNLQFSSLWISLVAIGVGLFLIQEPQSVRTLAVSPSPFLVARNMPTLGTSFSDISQDWGAPNQRDRSSLTYEGEQESVIFCFAQGTLIRIVQETTRDALRSHPCHDPTGTPGRSPR